MTTTTARKPRRKTAPRATAEERRAKAEALQQSIADQVEGLRQSDQWLDFLRFAMSFHHYSPANVMLIMEQCPEASHVAGFRQWQAKGRQVRKGETAIRIFGYAEKRIKAAQDDDTTESGDADQDQPTQARRSYYPMLSVFDISQTDVIEGENDPTKLARALAGDDPRGIAQAVTDYLTGEGWTVERAKITGAMNGFTDMTNRHVVVDASLSPAQTAKTLLHEAAHVILHADDAPGEYKEHRGVKETEAESVAYVVAGLSGLDTSDYTVGYVANWTNCDAEVIKNTAAAVLRGSHILAEAITAKLNPA